MTSTSIKSFFYIQCNVLHQTVRELETVQSLLQFDVLVPTYNTYVCTIRLPDILD